VLLIVLAGVAATDRPIPVPTSPLDLPRFLLRLLVCRRRACGLMWSQSTSVARPLHLALLFGAFYGGFSCHPTVPGADISAGRALGSIIAALYSAWAFRRRLGAPARWLLPSTSLFPTGCLLAARVSALVACPHAV